MEKDFYHREEVLISLGMMEHHGKTETEKHGSHAVWSMYIVWESCLGIKKVRHWSMVLYMDYWKNWKIVKMEDGIRELHRIINSCQINSVMLMHLFFWLLLLLCWQEKKMQKLCLKMHWNYLINGSGMKNRDLLMIPGIQNLQFLMIIAVLTQICIQ